jgi:peptide/nickel transport system substrate-binding protein
MKRLYKWLLPGLCLVVLGTLIFPAIAQDEGLGPGEGGIIINGNTTDDPATFNPLLANDGSSLDIVQWLYPALFTINPQTGESEPNMPGGLAESWSYDDTGTVLTIKLRQDLAWNDGTPITAADYLYSVDAVRSGQIDNSYASAFATMADGTPAGGKIVSVEAPDPYTVVVTFSEADCVAFESVNDIAVVPSHVFQELYGTDYAKMADDPRAIPTVSFGPFKDIEFDPAQRVSLVADQSYPDTILGYVSPEEWVYLSVPDENVETERFIAGDITILAVPSTRQNDFRTDPALANFQKYEFTGNGFTFFAMNTADPKNPQPGLDEKGNVIPQTPHPVLGDVLVRRAITQAVDMDAIIEGIRDGNGIKVATHTIPTSWVYNPDLQYKFDVEAAKALLDQAGWVDNDNDPSTPRVCQGCLYSREVDSSFEGSPLTIRLRVPEGGEIASQIGEFYKASLDEIGFDADFQAIDWGSAFLPELTGQTFDMALLSWSLGLPVDPDVTDFYTPAVDVPGAGFNFTSFYNEELNNILAEARVVPGCDPEKRKELYLRAQEILFNEAPYYYMYVSQSMTAVQPNLQNWHPTPYSRVYDTDAWVLLDKPQ